MMGSDLTATLFADGHAADIILGVLAIEAAWLRVAKGWRWADIAALLGTAALIVLGLRAAMVRADWYWIALPLAASLPLHLLDLRNRLRAKRADER
ncbi:hypothetical protein [Porphyrobacter sp. TH134]|uniref:hypothetical protein n=1 Tax=Porphyrobacter sp. TH134 TaxID=2067450 RepID=UPI001F3A2ECA|nr:hypothetical protein [Porphyrobacter sp. TH134]